MGRIWKLQSNMNRGELDPLLAGRKDLQSYYNGMETAEGVLSIPQGGLKKQPGTEFLGAALGSGRLENFSFNTEQNYVLVYTHGKVQIYKDGVLQTNINGSGNDYFLTFISDAYMQGFDYIQSADTAIITHPNLAPTRITRTGHTTWTYTLAPLTNIPQYDFNDGSSPTPTTAVQLIAFLNHVEGDRFKMALEGILTEEVVWSSNDATNIDNIEKALLALPNTPNSGITATVAAALVSYNIYFANEAAKNWELLTVTPTFTKNTTFQASSTIVTAGVARTEDVWSIARGWPVSCTFHEGRLWFGGSESRPATLWGSRPFDFFNFDQGKALPDDAVEVTLDTDQVNAITSVFSNRTLQIFTTGQEFYIPASPITPESLVVKPQSNLGSSRIRPITVDGSTYFAQKTGKAVIEFLFLNDLQAHQSKSISLLASHLINTPVKMAISRGTEVTDANYIYIVNDDGSMTVFNTLAAEDVRGFTRWVAGEDSTANGEILSVAVSDNQVYLLTQRQVNGSTVYLIERENTDYFTLSTVKDTTDDDEVTGLDHLEGETVWCVADGAFMGSFVVSSGTITLPRTSSDKYAGLQYSPIIKTMPLSIDLSNGPNASLKKKISRTSLKIYQSNGVIVNGERIADKTIGVDQFEAPIPQTELVRISLLGWSLEAQLTITQDTPMPLTVLNIGMEVVV